MKTTIRFAAGLLALAFAAADQIAGQTNNSSSLAGSWQLVFTPTGPASAAIVPIHALATFTSDGSTIETDAAETVPLHADGMSIYGTPGHGIWQPAPAVGTLFIQFINLRINENQSLYATRTVTISGALDSTGNEFSGNFAAETRDPAGHVISTKSGTVTGHRIPHPLLP
ncbi:MAG: hypothetical protein JO354_03250 [Verrucomicrobia bacterium]|nr:hypothetical protein [Verrucomicrobiota bacterium]